MNHRRGSVIVGWLIILGLLAARSVVEAARPEAESAGGRPFRPTAPYQNNELDQFFKAKTPVFSNDWAAVRSGMERISGIIPRAKCGTKPCTGSAAASTAWPAREKSGRASSHSRPRPRKRWTG